jgi:uncharacterized protein
MADDPSIPHPGRIPRDALRRTYEATRTIAVVGASTKEDRPAHYVPAYLAAQGYRVIGVSPRPGELFGERVRATLDEIDVPVDVVDVFRPAEEGPQVARDAARISARVIWFQSGTESEEAVRVASAAGLEVVTHWCMGMAHAMLGLGAGPEDGGDDDD